MLGMFSKFGAADNPATVGVLSRDVNGLPIAPCVCPRGQGAYVNNQGNCICAPDTVEVDANGNPIAWTPTTGYFPYPHDFYIAPANGSSGNPLANISIDSLTTWAKTNPLLAGAVALGIYVAFIKK